MKHVHKKENKLHVLQRITFILLGAFMAAYALESFLIPNSIIDGGVTGISIILAEITGWKLGIFLFALNLPFLYIGYKEIGKTFAISTFIGILSLSIFTVVLHGMPIATNDLLLSAVFGGILLGSGVGLAIRNSGTLDGVEVVAILFSEKLPFSVGEIVMFINLFILGSAGFVFGWENAMYSLITYFIAYKTIDIVQVGLDESKKITIISKLSDEIGEAIQDRLGRNVTFIQGKGGFTKEELQIVYCIVSRLEEAKVKTIITDIDEDAFIEVSSVADVRGGHGHFKKKHIH